MHGRAIAAVALGCVAVATVAVGWWEEVPPLTATEAVTATEEALLGAGLDASVAPDPLATTYVSRTRDPVDVWAVRATVRSEPIELQLARDGAQPVAIDDRSLDGASYVLSELEYEAVAAHVDDPARVRIVRRNIALTTAAVLVIAVALAHLAVSQRRTSR